MEQITNNFTLEELLHSNLAMEKKISNEANVIEKNNLRILARNVLQPIREMLGTPIVISSGFRNEIINKAVGGVPTSQHRLGQAADWSPKNMTPRHAFNRIIESNKIPYDQIILYDDGRNNFVHVSYNPNLQKQRGQVLYSKGTSIK